LIHGAGLIYYQENIKLEYMNKAECSVALPGANQAFVSFDGKGANQRTLRKFIESSYGTLDPVK